MKYLHRPRLMKSLVVTLALILALVVTGCGLSPEFFYQGRLTDAGGNPINGAVKLKFTFFDAASGGAAVYTETEDVTVTDGLFDARVGPGTAIAGLDPKILSQPLWIELEVSNGTYTETLSPRQQLLGAPYAFSLMPGTVISSTFGTTLPGSGGVDAVVSIYNTHDGDASDPALPALRIVSETGIELTSPTGDDGTVYSDQQQPNSDLMFYSQDNVQFYLDDNSDEAGDFYVYGEPGSYCRITDLGNLTCTGTITGNALLQSGEPVSLYAIQSPEVWFEDFGSAQLQKGAAFVSVEALFAEAANLGADYHVFLTPLGECNGLYVAAKSAAGFEVRELGGGTASIAFDYRIVAKRAGFETQRLEPLLVEGE